MKKIIDLLNAFPFKILLLIIALNLNAVISFSITDEHTDPSFEHPPFTLTVENLKIALENAGVQHADIVLRQAILETGWFKCTKCSLSSNNIFGFWYKKKYIQFDTWKDCVSYYKRWQDRHYSGGDYYVFLKKVGFATDPGYVKRLKSIKGI
jgi:hypothetical protein